MKVHELISLLQELDPDLEVVTSGYEGGYRGVDGVAEPENFVLNVNSAWYYGPHEKLQEQLYFNYLTLEQAEQKGIFKGVRIY